MLLPWYWVFTLYTPQCSGSRAICVTQMDPLSWSLDRDGLWLPFCVNAAILTNCCRIIAMIVLIDTFEILYLSCTYRFLNIESLSQLSSANTETSKTEPLICVISVEATEWSHHAEDRRLPAVAEEPTQLIALISRQFNTNISAITTIIHGCWDLDKTLDWHFLAVEVCYIFTACTKQQKKKITRRYLR